MLWGKVIGGAAGWVLGEFPGLAIGMVIGQGFDLLTTHDSGLRATPAHSPAGRSHWRRETALPSVVALVAKVADADGRVSEAEMYAFLCRYPLPPAQRTAVARLFDAANQSPEGFELHARRLASLYSEHPVELAALFELLTAVAHADGAIHPAQRALLQRVARIFGLPAPRWAREAADSNPSGGPWGTVRDADPDPFVVLGVAADAPLPEVKAAWRRLVQAHHPDRLEASGCPDALEVARNRTAEVNAAYNRIIRQRR